MRVYNRLPLSGDDLQNALPNPASQAGHAKSKHNFPEDIQSDINNPVLVFIGINDNGRQVTVFYKNGEVVITQDKHFTRVGGKQAPRTPVNPDKWAANPNYVEISEGLPKLQYSKPIISLNFVQVGPIDGQPVVFDDTVYFLSCGSKSEACFIATLLNSQPAREFLESMIFWSDKRPITIELLKRLNLRTLAQVLGQEEEYNGYAV